MMMIPFNVKRRELTASKRACAAAEAWAYAETAGKVSPEGRPKKNSPKEGELIHAPRTYFSEQFGVGENYVEHRYV